MTSAWHTFALSLSPQAAACSRLYIAERGPGHLCHGRQGHSKVPSTQVPSSPSARPRCLPRVDPVRTKRACSSGALLRGWPRGGQRDLGQGCAWGISTTPSCQGFRGPQAVKTSEALLWSTSSWCQCGAGFLQAIQPSRPNPSLNPLAHEPVFAGFAHARSFPVRRRAESADNLTGISPGADSTTEKSILLLPPAPCSSSHEIGPAPGRSTQGTSPTASQKTGHTPGWEGPRGFKTKPRYRQTAWHPHQALLEGCFTTLSWFLTSFRDQRTAPCPELSQQGTRQRVTRCQDSSRRGRQEESPPLLP